MGRKYRNCKTKRDSIVYRYSPYWRNRNSGVVVINNSIFEIKKSAVDELAKYRQTLGSEIGGVLTGSIISDLKIRISKVLGPCVSNSSKFGFTRDAKVANELIQDDYQQSENTRVYLGEWHTHPEDYPKPSAVDIQSMKYIYDNSHLVIAGVLLIIVGREIDYYGYYDGVGLREIVPSVI